MAGAVRPNLGGGRSETPSDVGKTILARVGLLTGGIVVLVGLAAFILWELWAH
jgi:hypothetical protein